MSSAENAYIVGRNQPSSLENALKTRLIAQLQQLRECTLTLIDGEECWVLGDGDHGLSTQVHIHDPAFYRHAALGGSVGAGESYQLGHWSCDELTTLVRILVRNREVLDGMETGLARLGLPLLKWLHGRNRNSRRGSRRNIAAHYDLGNALFELFLDRSMMYSCALFEDEQQDLETAQFAKLDRICRKLQLTADDHVLEIGTGWGGFAIHAATHYGCRVTTTTISASQLELARERVAAAGVSDRVELLMLDYRDLDGQYDKLVSIEMIEAVGHQYLPTYLSRVGGLLKDDGMALIQAITIEDHRFEKALREVDFIKRFIFPGSFIPSVSAICHAAAQCSDLRLFHLEDIGPSYALTLREWRRRFVGRLEQVRALGYPEEFVRMWTFYLCYCEGGFMERSIGTAQMLFTRPRCRRASVLGSLS